MWQSWGKRIFDLTAAEVALFILSPLIAILTVLVRVKLGGPVFFRQPRAGLHGTILQLVKFRSMTDEKDADGNLLPDVQRLPAFGLWLRHTSLDELPNLWNVLCGELSLVGPRPQLDKFLSLYSAEQMRRHDVMPGITGWAQVNGRNSITWEEKFELDVWYVDHASFALDMKILWMTLVKTMTREGINHGESATMPEFTGSLKNYVEQTAGSD